MGNVLCCFNSRGQQPCKFIGTKESVYIRKELNSHRIGHFHCFETITWLVLENTFCLIKCTVYVKVCPFPCFHFCCVVFVQRHSANHELNCNHTYTCSFQSLALGPYFCYKIWLVNVVIWFHCADSISEGLAKVHQAICCSHLRN